jgi:hypothetical protein
MKFNDSTNGTANILLCRTIMQDLANHIVHFMKARGSALKILSIRPSHVDAKDWLAADLNSYRWPQYSYTPGHVSTMGRDQTVAVPLKAATSKFPSNWALQHDI